MHLQRRIILVGLALAITVACGPDRPPAPASVGGRSLAAGSSSGVTVVNVSDDTTAQNETPLAVNPRNPQNLITGNNDWNYNDGCGVNASFDGGKSWTKTLPNGFLPGITKYTNDPLVPGTGAYDFAGDPYVAFGPDGTAYFSCFGYQGTPPYNVVLLLSRSYDGGKTWLQGPPSQPLTQAAVWQGSGNPGGGPAGFSHPA